MAGGTAVPPPLPPPAAPAAAAAAVPVSRADSAPYERTTIGRFANGGRQCRRPCLVHPLHHRRHPHLRRHRHRRSSQPLRLNRLRSSRCPRRSRPSHKRNHQLPLQRRLLLFPHPRAFLSLLCNLPSNLWHPSSVPRSLPSRRPRLPPRFSVRQCHRLQRHRLSRHRFFPRLLVGSRTSWISRWHPLCPSRRHRFHLD